MTPIGVALAQQRHPEHRAGTGQLRLVFDGIVRIGQCVGDLQGTPFQGNAADQGAGTGRYRVAFLDLAIGRVKCIADSPAIDAVLQPEDAAHMRSAQADRGLDDVSSTG